MTLEIAKLLSNALTQYIDNADCIYPEDIPADIALAQKLLDAADSVIANAA